MSRLRRTSRPSLSNLPKALTTPRTASSGNSITKVCSTYGSITFASSLLLTETAALIDPKSYVLPEKCKNPNSIRDTYVEDTDAAYCANLDYSRTHMRQVLFALMESAAGECDRKSFKITKGGLALARGGQTTKDRKNWSEASLATSES